MDDNMKEVYFSEYCEKCKNHDTKETDEPCNECLDIPMRYNSHKPEKFEEKK